MKEEGNKMVIINKKRDKVWNNLLDTERFFSFPTPFIRVEFHHFYAVKKNVPTMLM